MKRILVLTVILAALGSLAPLAMTAPEPYEVPTTWELDFDFVTPQPITLVLPGQKKPTTFWYMLYTVTNRTRDPETGLGVEQGFVPEFTMYTNTGETFIANKRPPAGVFNAIKKRHNNPLLQDHTQILGKLLFGKDNAKDGVAIWPDFNNKTVSIDVFVSGLSGETAELKLPRPIPITSTDINGVEVTEVKEKILLHKAMRLNFAIKGEPANRLYTTMKLVAKNWVLR
ncbi:MAG: hypothetical protein HN350_04830 [Phycisphaerales bacterium]|jgi:hypothetical protein|nr:hypothetical protein [Phycisphaerales bacterium]